MQQVRDWPSHWHRRHPAVCYGFWGSGRNGYSESRNCQWQEGSDRGKRSFRDPGSCDLIEPGIRCGYLWETGKGRRISSLRDSGVPSAGQGSGLWDLPNWKAGSKIPLRYDGGQGYHNGRSEKGVWRGIDRGRFQRRQDSAHVWK